MVQIQDIYVVGPQFCETLLHILYYVLSAEAGLVRERSFRVVHFRCYNRKVPFLLERFPYYSLAPSAGVCVSCVEEVDAVIKRVIDYPDRLVLFRLSSEHHRSEAEPRDFKSGPLDIQVFHQISLRKNDLFVINCFFRPDSVSVTSEYHSSVFIRSEDLRSDIPQFFYDIFRRMPVLIVLSH